MNLKKLQKQPLIQTGIYNSHLEKNERAKKKKIGIIFCKMPGVYLSLKASASLNPHFTSSCVSSLYYSVQHFFSAQPIGRNMRII